MRSAELRRVDDTLRRWRAAIPRPFTPEAFCATLSATRGRPIHLVPWDTVQSNDVPSGLWIASSQADYIFHDGSTTALHQRHIIFHEIGHVLLGHQSRTMDLRGFPVASDSSQIVAILGRGRTYDEQEEREAELFATRLAALGARRRRDVADVRPGVGHDVLVLERLSAALAGDRPWRR